MPLTADSQNNVYSYSLAVDGATGHRFRIPGFISSFLPFFIVVLCILSLSSLAQIVMLTILDDIDALLAVPGARRPFLCPVFFSFASL